MTPISIFLKASILISAAVLAHAVWGRRMSAAARHLMWTLTIVGLCCFPHSHSSCPPGPRSLHRRWKHP